MEKKKEQVAVKTKSVTNTQIMVAVVALAIAGGLAFAALPAKKGNFALNEVAGKCGVNSIKLSQSCGKGSYRGIDVVCHDGEEFTFGGSSSCKPSRTWNQLAQNACVGHCAVPPEEVVNCTDSDGGVNYDEFGTVEYNLRFEEDLHRQVNDSCAEGGRILERYCDEQGLARDNTEYVCQFGCGEGVCLSRPASLEVSSLNDLPEVSVLPGALDVVLAHIRLDAGESSESILVSQLRVIDDVNEDARTIDMQNVRLMLGDTVLDSRSGSNQVEGEAQILTFNIDQGEFITVPVGESVDVQIVGNVASNAVGGSHTFSLVSPDTLVAQGADSQNSVEETIENQTGETVTISVDSPEIVIRPGTYNFDLPLFISGTSPQISSYIIYTSSTEPIGLKELVLHRSEVAPGLSSPFDITNAHVYLGNRLVSSVVPVGESIHFLFNDNDVVVTNQESVEIFVRGDLARISPLGPVREGGHNVGLVFESADDLVAEGVLSGQAADVVIDYGRTIRSSDYKFYKGLPIFSRVDLNSNTLQNGTNDLFRLGVSSDEDGSNISLSKITFDIRKSNSVNINNIEVFDEELNELLFTLDSLPTVENNRYRIEAEIGERFISNRGKTFVLRASVSGARLGEFIRISIPADQSVDHYNGKAMGTYQEVVDTGRANTIWSDVHSQGHSMETSDWANAYYLLNPVGRGQTLSL